MIRNIHIQSKIVALYDGSLMIMVLSRLPKIHTGICSCLLGFVSKYLLNN